MPRAGSLLSRAAPVAALLGACSLDSPIEPSLIFDRHRHARFTPDAATLFFYRQDERPGGVAGLSRVDLSTGEEVVIVSAFMAGFDLHPSGQLAVFSARPSDNEEPALWLTNLEGTSIRRLTGGTYGHRWPAFSPDGTRISWEARPPGEQDLDTLSTLWVADWQDSAIANARALAPGRRSAWRPDGAALVIERRRPGNELPHYIVVIDTGGRPLDTLGLGVEPHWRPDGAEVAYFTEVNADRGCLGVCFVPAAGGTPRPLSTGFASLSGAWSPDGSRYAYTRVMETYRAGEFVEVEIARLWIRDLSTSSDRQVTF
jgi:Tol biopolymer transport system component